MPNNKNKTSKAHGEKEGRGELPPQESVWEWIVAAIGALLVATTLGYLLYEAVRPSTPPDINVELTGVQPSGDRYLVRFVTTNEGSEGASSVTIQGELRDAQGEVETASATIAYIAPGSAQSGGLYFSHDPSTLHLDLYATGYEEP